MATPRTGRPRGRPAGARNKRTEATARAAVQSAEKITKALGAKAFEGDAHAYLMSVYKDQDQPTNIRLDAAGKALPYEKPRLSSVEMTGADGSPLLPPPPLVINFVKPADDAEQTGAGDSG